MATSLGIEFYCPMRDRQELSKLSYPNRPNAVIVSSTVSTAADDFSRQSSDQGHMLQLSTMEDSSNVKNRAFISSNHQPSSRHLHLAASGSERDSSTWANTGAPIVFSRKSPSTLGNQHSDHVRPIQMDEVIQKPTIQRSQSFEDVTGNSDCGVDSVIEEKRKRPNGDGYTIHRYSRGKLLGKGGFAKVYLCTALDTGKNYAVKVVPKANLVKARARQKLQAEIKIHRNLKHKHVCQYKHYFEDRNNCYILLELCHNQSMNEMIKRRKRLTEPEAAYFILQVLSATRYMHNENVIHRDLKLGNLFLDKDMVVKVGDLGLATRLEDKDEKRKTICGTPNYIAPEIIQGDKSKRGHSFEVDIWSIGVILYTILIGKPPYEAKDVKATYQRILNNEYSFPRHIDVSERAKNLIQSMLQSNPADRPTLDQIEAHPFLSQSDIPRYLPSSVMTVAPVWRIDERGELVCNEEKQTTNTKKQLLPPHGGRQPFLSRDPNLAKASSTTTPHGKTSYVGSEINIERIGKNALATMTSSKSNTKATSNPNAPAFKIFDESAGPVKTKIIPLKSQTESVLPRLNATSHTRMVSSTSKGRTSPPNGLLEMNTRDPADTRLNAPNFDDELLTTRTHALSLNTRTPADTKSVLSSVVTNATSSVLSNFASDVDVLKRMADHLDAVIEITEQRKGSYSVLSPHPISSRRGPTKWVTRYVDYTSKYGLGFLLNDGSSGVYFNDSTKTALERDGDTFQYIERKKYDEESSPRRGETTLETHSLENYPESLKKKVTLLKHFRNYLIEQQMKSESDEDKRFHDSYDIFGVPELVYVKKWVRTKHAIMFFLSNRTVQVVFYDQTEILFTPDVLTLTYVDKNRVRATYSFTDELVGSLPEIEKRLKYTKEIMIQLLSGHRS